MDPEKTFIESLPIIERIVAILARRHALDADTADDFASWTRERLIENDYRIIRQYNGRGSVAAYLTVVITNLLRDFNNRRWGRWRPSAEARRLGVTAVRLETLLYRDGLPFAEAASRLCGSDAAVRERELATIAMRLPPRHRTRVVGDAALATEPARERSDDDVLRNEARAQRDAVYRALHTALGGLDAEDQLILRMRFWSDASVADIARTLDLEQKPLYRRIDRLRARLRLRLEAEGIASDVLTEAMEEGP